MRRLFFCSVLCFAGLAGCSEDTKTTDAGPSSSGSDAGTAVRCTPSAAECVGAVARVCATSGDAWNEVTCSNGCEAGSCNPVSLSTGWSVHQFVLTDDDVPTPASYTFEDNGLIAVQSANPMASVYLNDTALPRSVVVAGSFSVQTTSDDDLIGFVFGWQDPQHFYLVDWKQTRQPAGVCGIAEAGAALKVVSSSVALDRCADFWASVGTGRVTPIVPVTTNPNGWLDMTEYEVRLNLRPGNIDIEIRQGETVVVSISSNDTTYGAGKFGFFNYSQEAVRYEFFSFSPLD